MFPSCMATNRFQIYKDYFILGDSALHKKLISEIYPEPKASEWKKGPRISQGTLCFLYFDRIIQTQSQLDFVGFDFFESILKFELGGKQKQIYSWHVPIPMDNHEHNPHGADKEKDYEVIHLHTYREMKEEMENAIRILKMTDEEVVSTSTYNAIARYL